MKKLILFLSFMLAAAAAQAEIKSINITIFGMD